MERKIINVSSEYDQDEYDDFITYILDFAKEVGIFDVEEYLKKKREESHG